MTEAVSPKLHCHFCNNAGNAALSSSPTLPSLSCVPVRGGRLSASQVHSLCRSNWREAVSLTLQYFGNKQATAEFSFFFSSENCSFYLFLSWLSFSCHRGTTSAVYKPVSTQHLSKGWRSQDFISDRLRISTGS